MAKQPMQKDGPPMRRPDRGLGWTELATLAGLAIVVFVSIENWNATRALQTSLQERIGKIDDRLNQVATKVDQVGNRAAAQAQPRGPDPNKVYAVKTDGAPFQGPKAAPVTIAEFSDFQ
jgi:protein-disulfide isomerase